MNQNPPTDEELGQIEARLAAATDGPWGAYTFGGDTLIEIAADLEETGTGYRARREICRLEDEPLDNDPTHREWTAEEDWEQVQADAEFIAHSPGDVRVLLAEVRCLRAYEQRLREQHDHDVAELNRLRSRVAELERPAIEAQRNEIRQSFTEIAAQCEQDRDYEAAANFQLRLREREEQWAREDAADKPAAPTDPDALPAWLRQRFTATTVRWEDADDDDRSYWEHQARAVRRAVARGGFKAATSAPAVSGGGR